MNKNLELFLTFMKIGAMTFGGGYAMIANVEDEIVSKKKWLSSDELLEMIAISESTPGPIIVNLATFIGYRNGKVLGSLLATLGAILPSFLIILLISFFLDSLSNIKIISYLLDGLKCGACFLILKSFLRLFKTSKLKWYQLILLIVSAILMIMFSFLSIKFSAIYLILIGGLVGLITNLIIEKRGKIK